MRKYKSLFIALFSITIVNYLDRSALSFSIQPISKAFDINTGQFGLLTSAFGMGYFLASLCSGYFVDRFTPERIWASFATIWSILMLGMSFATNFWTLFFLRLALGLTEAMHFPALLKTVAEVMQPKWYARAMSLALFGVPMSVVVGAPLFSNLIIFMGWRSIFFILCVLGIGWAMFWQLHFRPFVTEVKREFTENEQCSYREVFASPIIWGNILQAFIFGYFLLFILFWLPGYFEEKLKEPILTAGYMIMVPWAFASVAMIVGGWISDKIKNISGSLWYARALFIGLSMAASGASFYTINFVTGVGMNIFLLSLGLVFAMLCNAALLSFSADLFAEKAGTAQGLVSTLFSVAAFVSPLVTGFVVQKTGSFDPAFTIIGWLALAALAIPFIFQLSSRNIPT